jgi:hypothetical protein
VIHFYESEGWNMTAVDVLDVAKYILEYQDKPLTTMKLQKLAYYAQAWHATWADSDRLIKQWSGLLRVVRPAPWAVSY